jgi:hypothetical protein
MWVECDVDPARGAVPLWPTTLSAPFSIRGLGGLGLGASQNMTLCKSWLTHCNHEQETCAHRPLGPLEVLNRCLACCSPSGRAVGGVRYSEGQMHRTRRTLVDIVLVSSQRRVEIASIISAMCRLCVRARDVKAAAPCIMDATASEWDDVHRAGAD